MFDESIAVTLQLINSL